MEGKSGCGAGGSALLRARSYRQKTGYQIPGDAGEPAGRLRHCKGVSWPMLPCMLNPAGGWFTAHVLLIRRKMKNRRPGLLPIFPLPCRALTTGCPEACRNAEVTIGYEDGNQQIYLNGENITSRLRQEEVGNMASKSSAVPKVREKLLDLQRTLAAEKDVVMDGRDIGTNVLPQADVKVFLTADARTRAKRRYDELTAKGISCNLDEIESDIRERDERDMNRETAPLKQAEDAVLIDSSHMSIPEVVSKILSLCK